MNMLKVRITTRDENLKVIETTTIHARGQGREDWHLAAVKAIRNYVQDYEDISENAVDVLIVVELNNSDGYVG